MRTHICPVCRKGRRSKLSFRGLARHFSVHKLGKYIEYANGRFCKRCDRWISLKELRMYKNGYCGVYCKKCEEEIGTNYVKNHPDWAKKQLSIGYLKWKMRATGGKCKICGENRTLDIAHIIPRKGKNKSRLEPTDNLIGLCPTHHRLFDENKLSEGEYSKIDKIVNLAIKKYG